MIGKECGISCDIERECAKQHFHSNSDREAFLKIFTAIGLIKINVQPLRRRLMGRPAVRSPRLTSGERADFRPFLISSL